MSPHSPAPSLEAPVSEELAVGFEPDGSGGLRLRVLRPLGGGQATFQAPFIDDERRELLSRLGDRTRHLEMVETATDADSSLRTEEVGRRLFDALASGEIRRALGSLLDRVFWGDLARLRLRLVFDPTDRALAAVAALPWELLFDPRHHRFLARSAEISVVRQVAGPAGLAALRPGWLPLRVLAAYANPGPGPPLDLDREARRIRDAFAPLADRVEVETIEARSPSDLLERLETGRFHVLHFLGHGDFDPESGEGRLHFGGAGEPAHAVSGAKLASMLEAVPELRMAVLNACDTARFERRSDLDPYSGTAQALVRGGLPAVVAMQWPISDRGAIAFATALYAALAGNQPVDAAVARGRRAIAAEQTDTEEVEWAAPVLFLQVEDGRILDLRPQPRSPRRVLRTAALVLIGLLGAWSLWAAFDPGLPYRTWLNPPECPSPEALGEAAGMRFQLIQPGRFQMGSETGDKDERPVHPATIDRPFCMGTTEVTRKQWRAVMGEDNEEQSDDEGPIDPNKPQGRVTYERALEYARLINESEGEDRCRLPRETEWEFGARAGTTTAYSFGDDSSELVNYGNCLSGPETSGDEADRTVPVGKYRSNPWGLYDLYGNVQEWVSDPYEPYPGASPEDLDSGSHKAGDPLRRGGAYDSESKNCTSAARNPASPTGRYQRNGLRLVCEPRPAR